MHYAHILDPGGDVTFILKNPNSLPTPPWQVETVRPAAVGTQRPGATVEESRVEGAIFSNWTVQT